MRRITWILALVLGVTMVLAGCGKKDAGSVVSDLDKLVGSMDSYQASGTMTIQTGQEPQDYQVEVWYKTKHYYRISLVNAKKDISQIVLRNDEGVFVLTPHLNKSFRFKSDWPENQGQVYLYQSLVQSIVADKDRQFTTDKSAYVFDVAANYQNASNLARQRIWLNKKDYAPQHVEVSDANANIKVIVDFKQFEFGKKFDKDSFDMKRNLTAWNMSTVPTIEQQNVEKVDKVKTDAAAKVGDEKTTTGSKDPAKKPEELKLTFGSIEPGYTPDGVTQQDITEITLAGAKAILMRYTGDYHYSIVQSKPQVQEATASALNGEIVDLGFTLAVITGDENKTMEWLDNGMEFKLSTGDLPKDEMINVAMSIEGQSSK
jgi:outer membrane lipoprotein-sorting protein